MIKFKDREIENYQIDYENGHIIDSTTNEIVEEFFKKNYLHVRIKTNKNRTRVFPVHILICHTFYGFTPNFEVHHLNEVKTDNRKSNLAYISHEEHSSYTGATNFKNAWKNNREKMLKNCSEAGKKAMQNASKEFHSKGGKIGCKALIDYWTPERKAIQNEKNRIIMKNKVWINDGKINRRVDKELVEQYIKNGFVLGRVNFHKRTFHV